MGKIFYSMAGEGRGHAARAQALVEQLRHDHQLELFAPHQAYEMLAPVYENTDIRVNKIPGIYFHYTGRRLDHAKSVWQGLRYLCGLPGLVSKLAARVRAEKPDLVITDFEPALPRAAYRCGVPYLSINHQHFLLVNDLSCLPPRLRLHAWVMSQVVRLYHGKQVETVVSSFFFPPLRPGWERTVQVGTLLRPEILNMRPRRGDYIVAYLRPYASERVLDALERHGRPVRVYGFDAQPPRGCLDFRPIDAHTFLEDLANCDFLISAAGNQSVGEALYLGKPVLGIAEHNHYEQLINAHFLRASGAGDWVLLDHFAVEDVRSFAERRDQFQTNIDPDRLNGMPRTLDVLRRHLPAPSLEEAAAGARRRVC